MTEERAKYVTPTLTKLKGRGGPGRGQGAPTGNRDASKGKEKRVKVSITLSPGTQALLLQMIRKGHGKSLGQAIDLLAQVVIDGFWEAIEER